MNLEINDEKNESKKYNKNIVGAIIIVLVAAVFIAYHLQKLDEFSNNIALVVEVAVGAIITVIVFGATKKSEEQNRLTLKKMKKLIENVHSIEQTQNSIIEQMKPMIEKQGKIIEKQESLLTSIEFAKQKRLKHNIKLIINELNDAVKFGAYLSETRILVAKDAVDQSDTTKKTDEKIARTYLDYQMSHIPSVTFNYSHCILGLPWLSRIKSFFIYIQYDIPPEIAVNFQLYLEQINSGFTTHNGETIFCPSKCWTSSIKFSAEKLISQFQSLLDDSGNLL